MNARKTIRDAIIILIVIVIAFFAFRSRNPGPVEQVAGSDPHSHTDAPDTGMPAGHPTRMFELSDGEPVVRLGDRVIGRDWLDQTIMRQKSDLVSRGFDESTADRMSQIAALEVGMEDVLFYNAIKEYGLTVDPAEIDRQEQEFYATFDSREKADQLLQEMGVTIDRVRKMWEDDILIRMLSDKIAVMHGLEPGSDEASNAYSSWVQGQIIATEWQFEDQELGALFEDFRNSVLEEEMPEESAVSAGETEPALSDDI